MRCILAVVTPVKYECDSTNLTDTFAKASTCITWSEKLTNTGPVPPPWWEHFIFMKIIHQNKYKGHFPTVTFLRTDIPEYGCGDENKFYSDCSPICGHCSDLSTNRFVCEECVQGCRCQGNDLMRGDRQQTCSSADQCPCTLETKEGEVPNGEIRQIGCHNWWGRSYSIIVLYIYIYIYIYTEMLSFWWNFRHWLSKWRHLRFCNICIWLYSDVISIEMTSLAPDAGILDMDK